MKTDSETVWTRQTPDLHDTVAITRLIADASCVTESARTRTRFERSHLEISPARLGSSQTIYNIQTVSVPAAWSWMFAMNKLQPDPQHPGPITTIASGLERIILPKGDTVDQDQPDLAQRANLGVHAADLVRLRSIEESERRTQGVGSRLRRTPL